MRCISCGEDIPPKWVAVIEKNACPSCDGPIMTDDSILLKEELAEALAKMPNDPQGVTGWLLSNYRVQKIAEGEPVQRFNRPGAQQQRQQQGGGGGAEQQGIKHATNAYQELLERTHMAGRVNSANAAAQTNMDKISAMRANIGSLPDPHDPIVDTSPDEMSSREDYDATKELMEAGIDPFNPPASGGGGAAALTPQQIMAIQNRASPNQDMGDFDGERARSNVGHNDDGQLTDAEKLLIRQTGQEGQEIIHNQRATRIKAQAAVSSGTLDHPQGFYRSG